MKFIFLLLLIASKNVFCCENISDVNDAIKPCMLVSNEKIIIYNYPCKEETLLRCVFIHSGVCSSKHAITFDIEGLVVIIERDCCCDVNFCDECGLLLDKEMYSKCDAEISCKYWCDKVAFSAQLMCGTAFSATPCKVACAFLVEALRDICHDCCKDGEYYRNCVKPFETFLDQVRCPMEPE